MEPCSDKGCAHKAEIRAERYLAADVGAPLNPRAKPRAQLTVV